MKEKKRAGEVSEGVGRRLSELIFIEFSTSERETYPPQRDCNEDSIPSKSQDGVSKLKSDGKKSEGELQLVDELELSGERRSARLTSTAAAREVTFA